MEAMMAVPSRQDQKQDEKRSENLLPAGSQDDGQDAGQDDGRFDVAEEVNLDQQGDMARQVGKAPKGIASDALANSLADQGDDQATS
jgi:hypothetical protein